DEADPDAIGGSDFTFGLILADDSPDLAPAAPTRQIGQCLKRRACPAVMVQERTESSRSDIFAADQPQPVQTLLICQAKPRCPKARTARIHIASMAEVCARAQPLVRVSLRYGALVRRLVL